MPEAVIVEAVRTPIGRGKAIVGDLNGFHATELLALSIKEVIRRTGIKYEDVGQLIGGCVTQAGEQSGNVTRNAFLSIGGTYAPGASTVDTQCGSAQQANHMISAFINNSSFDIGIACGVESMSRVTMGANVFIYLSKSDYPSDIAATGVSLLFIGGLVGKIIAGVLAEKIGHKRVLLTGLALMSIGSISLVYAVAMNNSLAVWIGLAFFGFGWGGIYTLIQLLTADLFGLLAMGKTLACINILDAFGGAMGPIVTGALYDKTGSYLTSFSIFSVLLLISVVAASLIRMADAVGMPESASHD